MLYFSKWQRMMTFSSLRKTVNMVGKGRRIRQPSTELYSGGPSNPNVGNECRSEADFMPDLTKMRYCWETWGWRTVISKLHEF